MNDIFASVPWWMTILFYLGVTVGASTLALFMVALTDSIKKLVGKIIYIYKYKHRFNKRPLAKCYCKDCENWHPHSPQATEGKCWGHPYVATTADNWFCWDAEPRDHERKTE